MKGRKRESAETLRARGSEYAEQRAKVEVKVRPGEPEPPDHLNDKELAEWRRFVPTLAAMGVLMPVDAFPLAGLYTLRVMHRELCAKIEQAEGKEQLPLHRVLSKLNDQLFRLEQSFGMSAQGRRGLTGREGHGRIPPLLAGRPRGQGLGVLQAHQA